MHNNTFAADFFLKTWNFHCTRRSKNWEFQILQTIDFLKTTKMNPECEDLLRLLVCASWSCIGVSWTCRDIAITTFWIYIPPPPASILPSQIKSIFFLMLRVSWAVNGTKMELRSPLSFCRMQKHRNHYFLNLHPSPPPKLPLPPPFYRLR